MPRVNEDQAVSELLGIDPSGFSIEEYGSSEEVTADVDWPDCPTEETEDHDRSPQQGSSSERLRGWR